MVSNVIFSFQLPIHINLACCFVKFIFPSSLWKHIIVFCLKALSTNSFLLTHTSIKLIIPSSYNDSALYVLTGLCRCTSAKLWGTKQHLFSVPLVGIVLNLPMHFSWVVRDWDISQMCRGACWCPAPWSRFLPSIRQCRVACASKRAPGEGCLPTKLMPDGKGFSEAKQ